VISWEKFLGIHNYLVVRDASTALALIINSVSKKSLRLASWSRVQWPTGRVVNLVTVDAEALAAAAPYRSPYMVTIALSLVYLTIGPPVIGAVIIMILYVPFNYCFSLIIKSYQTRQMQMKDNRVKFTK
ncbi:hypothetical protein OSTOST_08457, partial [Ostertagia ostertagi]